MNIIFFSPFIGNLYTRQVQIEGETLAIQVQDTPGIQVRSSEVCDQVSGEFVWLQNCSVVLRVPHAKGGEEFGELVKDFTCYLTLQQYLAVGQFQPGLIWEICLRGGNLLLGVFCPAEKTKSNVLGIGKVSLLQLKGQFLHLCFWH